MFMPFIWFYAIELALFFAYAGLLFLRAHRKVIGQALVVLGIVVVADFLVGLFGLLDVPSQARYSTASEFVYLLFCIQYVTFVKSEAYTHYQLLPIHRHVLAALIIFVSVGLEVLILSYFFGKGWWLWGFLLMLLVAGLSVGWLIWWYRWGSSPR